MPLNDFEIEAVCDKIKRDEAWSKLVTSQNVVEANTFLANYILINRGMGATEEHAQGLVKSKLPDNIKEGIIALVDKYAGKEVAYKSTLEYKTPILAANIFTTGEMVGLKGKITESKEFKAILAAGTDKKAEVKNPGNSVIDAETLEKMSKELSDTKKNNQAGAEIAVVLAAALVNQYVDYRLGVAKDGLGGTSMKLSSIQSTEKKLLQYISASVMQEIISLTDKAISTKIAGHTQAAPERVKQDKLR